MPHAGVLGGAVHVDGVRVVQREGFFAQDMLLRGDRITNDARVKEIRRGDDDRVDIRMCDRVVVVEKRGADAGRLRGFGEHARIAVADRNHLRLRRKRQAGKVIRQGDRPAPIMATPTCCIGGRLFAAARPLSKTQPRRD